MKRFKKVFILLGVLVVLCIGVFVVKRVEEHKEQIRTTDEVILSVPADSVRSLSWEYEDTSLSFRKTDAWQWDEDSAFPVDEDKIHDLLSIFEDFGAAFIIEDVEDFSQYGLDDPTCTIRFATDSQDYEVLLGAFSTMDSQRYVSIGDGNVYLVKKDPFNSYKIELKDTILQDKAPSFDKVTEIRFRGSENYTIDRDEESSATYCPNDLYFTTVNGKTVPLDTGNVEQYYANISLTSLKNYVSYNVTGEELDAWGLAEPELTVAIDYTVTDKEENESSESFTLHVGRNQEELAAKAEAEAKDEEYSGTVTAYARVGESQIVYQITDSEYRKLAAAAYNDLRHKEVLTADFDSITQIDADLEEAHYSITSEIPEDSEEDTRIFSYDGEEISLSNIRTQLSALKVAEFTDAAPEEKEEIALTFHLDNENYPQVSVQLFRYDGTYCLAVLDGESIGLVSRASVVDLIEAVNSIVLG